MYRDEVENPKGIKPKYNAPKRRAEANAFFAEIKPNKSLIFYYANYSNPFSTEEENRYVVVGMSRIKQVGDELTWTDQSKKMEENYGPNVWLRSITSNYPEQGLRIPYHAYMDQPDVLERILFVPDNPRSFKYATRHISDDGALGLVERMLEIVSVLEEIGDTHEAWGERKRWLTSLIAELWQHRGLYPGLLRVWESLGFREAIPFCKAEIEKGNERQVKDSLFNLLYGKVDIVDGLQITASRLHDVRRQWQLMDFAQQVLLEQELPRFDLQPNQIDHIIRNPESVSIYAQLDDVGDNPYLLCEQYEGSDPDDQITFRQIDNGKFPDPDLGDDPEFAIDSWQRLRALCIDHLKRHQQHSFLSAQMVLENVNRTLSFMPDWKRGQYVLKHFYLDRTELEKGLALREEDDQLYLYRREVYEDERLVESVLRELAGRPDIRLKSPMTEGHWQTYLRDETSLLAERYPSDYAGVLAEQANVCAGIFLRPVRRVLQN